MKTSIQSSINCKGKLLSFDEPKVMGIINATPDSFYSKSRVESTKSNLLGLVEQMIKDGVDIIDVGGQSSRPGAKKIGEQEELERVIPVVSEISSAFPEVLISIDTYYASVAKSSVEHGAHIVNDISFGELDKQMFPTVAKLSCPYIGMHMQNSPDIMQQNPTYKDVLTDVFSFFVGKINEARSFGIKDIVIDPGFGFGKLDEHNYSLLAHLSQFRFLNCPILVGISRKSMIKRIIDVTTENALNGTTALNMVALMNQANILRVHDVKEAVETVKLFKKLKQSGLNLAETPII